MRRNVETISDGAQAVPSLCTLSRYAAEGVAIRLIAR